MTRSWAQGVTVVTVTLCAGLCLVQPSYAGLSAQTASATQQIGSAEWSAVPTTTTLDFGSQSIRRLYFSVINTGTLPLLGATYTLSGSGLPRNATLAVQGCVGGAWNTATGTCSGTTVPILSSPGPPAAASVSTAGLFPAALGSSVSLQATIDKNPQAATSGSVSVSVTRADVRPPTTTYS